MYNSQVKKVTLQTIFKNDIYLINLIVQIIENFLPVHHRIL